MKIWSIFVAFLENMNFTTLILTQAKGDLSEMKAQGFRDVQEIAYLKALLECPSNYSPFDQSVQPTKTDEERKFIFIT